MAKQKNDPQNQPAQKKPSPSVLEMIRRRTGLLVGIVGLALLIFILQSLLDTGNSIFGGDENTVGLIEGNKVDRNEFISRLENRLNQYRARNQGGEVDDNVKGQAIDNIWQQYIVEYAIMPRFKKAGIIVGEDELYEKVVANPAQSILDALTDPNTGKLSEQFARPDGSLDLVKWKQAVQSVVGEQEMAVKSMEDEVKNTVYFQKFRALVKKGIYATTAEAKMQFRQANSRYEISYVFQPNYAISDSAVQLSDADLKKYYTDHSWEFMNKDVSRRIEFVIFNVFPSPEDISAIEEDAKRVAKEFQGQTPGEDSLLMAQESENGNIVIRNYTKKTMIIRDSSVFAAEPGTVFGPYNEGSAFKIYKLQDVKSVADSARVRHILVGTSDPQTNEPKRSKEQAKREADSLLVLIKNKQISFDSLVINYSDDFGSRDKGGDYGWFDENEQFVEPYKNAGIMGTKGNISVVETQFGYHIIEVLDVSPTRHTSYKIAQISKPIVASDETNQSVFARATKFYGENNTGEKFDKATDAQKLSKRLADNVGVADRQLPGLEGAREIVNWAYAANKGDVGIFSLPGKHVVAKLSGIKEKGVLPFESVKDEVMVKARAKKRSEMLLAEFKSKAGNAKSVEEFSDKLKIELVKQDNFIVEGANIDRVGRDLIMTGCIEGTSKGKLTGPAVGNEGVFVVTVNSISTEAAPQNYKAQKKQIEDQIAGSSDYLSYNALKELSEIRDFKSRID